MISFSKSDGMDEKEYEQCKYYQSGICTYAFFVWVCTEESTNGKIKCNLKDT
jgi:hypothetical protein